MCGYALHFVTFV